MKQIAILVPEGAVLGSVEGPRQVFTEVNNLFSRMGRQSPFKVQLVGVKQETSAAGGRYSVHSDIIARDVRQVDLVIIPAIDGEMPNLLDRNASLIPWIVKQRNGGAEVASLCVGAFLLASTGLVNGRKCATHWMAANEFRRMFPEVELVEDRIITDDQGIYSSGGAFSYLNLILYLVEKYTGRDTAIFMSKAFQIDFDRRSQSAFAIFQGQKDHEDESIKKAQDYIEKNAAGKISLDHLADAFAIGRRSLERRFKKATGNTVIEYIQRVKVEAAKKLLETTTSTINETMYHVGYTDLKAFRTVFRKITGLSPLEYKTKYGMETKLVA